MPRLFKPIATATIIIAAAVLAMAVIAAVVVIFTFMSVLSPAVIVMILLMDHNHIIVATFATSVMAVMTPRSGKHQHQTDDHRQW